jgi:hypothetical protein
MKAVFSVKTIEADWKPPFKKNIQTQTFDVQIGGRFDRIVGNGNDEPVFELLELNGEKAKLKYSTLFTLKNYNHTKEKVIELKIGAKEKMTYLWGEKGITKEIEFKNIAREELLQEPEKAF